MSEPSWKHHDGERWSTDASDPPAQEGEATIVHAERKIELGVGTLSNADIDFVLKQLNYAPDPIATAKLCSELIERIDAHDALKADRDELQTACETAKKVVAMLRELQEPHDCQGMIATADIILSKALAKAKPQDTTGEDA